MTKKNLNPTFLESATSKGKDRLDIFDVTTAGLAIRITNTGKKTWCFAFTVPGTEKRARLTLGTFPATPLADARIAAEKARGLVEAGKDPRQEAIRPVEKTIAELVDDRIRLVVRASSTQFLRTCMEIERIYDKDVIPLVGKVAVKDFEITHLNRVIDPVVARGSRTQANRVYEAVNALMEFAVARGERKYNPIASAKPPSEEQARERFLSLEEIPIFWNKAPVALAGHKTKEIALKLCLVLLRRASEVLGMRRPEIDIGKRLWTIPKERVKGRNKKAKDLVVPLSPLAFSLIEEAMRRTNDDILFPNWTGEECLLNADLAHKLADAQELFGLTEPFTSHDLRRTGATQMSIEENGMDIPEHYISHVLNHTSVTKSSVTKKHYIVNTYANEKRFALDRWGAFLEKLVGIEVQQQEAA